MEVGNGVGAKHRVHVVSDGTNCCPFVGCADIANDAIDFGVLSVEAIDPDQLLFGKGAFVLELLGKAPSELPLACVDRGEAIALLFQRCVVDAFPFLWQVSRSALRVAHRVGARSARLPTLVFWYFTSSFVMYGSHWFLLSGW